MVNIKGSTVVVTGGQRGLGKAIVDEFLQRGAAKVYATARAPKPSADPRVVSVELDVTKPESVAALAITAADADIVINNAGVLGAPQLLTSDIEEVKAVFETNYFGALRVAKAFAPVLADNGGGALVDISSVLAWVGGFGARAVAYTLAAPRCRNSSTMDLPRPRCPPVTTTVDPLMLTMIRSP